MGHEHIETTDRYLRAIAVDTCVLSEVLDSLHVGSGRVMRAARRTCACVAGCDKDRRSHRVPLERIDAPRQVRGSVIDFSTSVAAAGCTARARGCILEPLRRALRTTDRARCGRTLKSSSRFVAECASAQEPGRRSSRPAGALHRVAKRPVPPNGAALDQVKRVGAYTTLSMLLQWLARCRPGTLGELHYPVQPLPIPQPRQRACSRGCPRAGAARDSQSLRARHHGAARPQRSARERERRCRSGSAATRPGSLRRTA